MLNKKQLAEAVKITKDLYKKAKKDYIGLFALKPLPDMIQENGIEDTVAFLNQVIMDRKAMDESIPQLKGVGIDGKHIADAYCDEHRWNGWACPYFEKEQAEKVIDWLQNDCDVIVAYDETNDAYITRYKDDDESDAETWKGIDVKTVDGVKHVYSIGGWSWCWELTKK